MRPRSGAAPGSAATTYSFNLSFKGVRSQTFTVLSKLAEARRSCFLSGLNATQFTTPLWPVKVWIGSPPVLASQSFTLVSSPPEATHRPSGLNATPQTGAAWPRRVNNGVDGGLSVVVASQTFTVLSSP